MQSAYWRSCPCLAWRSAVLNFAALVSARPACSSLELLSGTSATRLDHETLDFVKELGLILFVFNIGLQLGPGFFAALRPQGVRHGLSTDDTTAHPVSASSDN